MSGRRWNGWQPHNLADATSGCIDYARERHNLSVDQIAERMGLANKWCLYKWVASGAMPVRLVRAFEHACGADFVTRWLAASGHLLVLPMPSGRRASPSDIAALQQTCTAAVQALIEFTDGRRSQPETLAVLTIAMTRLAAERGHVERYQQPELPL